LSCFSSIVNCAFISFESDLIASNEFGYNTFKRWIYIKSNQAAEIPSSALLKMAGFFDVSPEALFSNPPTSQSIHDKLMLFFQENAAL